MKLINKHIVITGGTSGIGYQMVKTLHSQNQVTVIGRCPDKLNQLKSLSGKITTYQADLANIEEVKTAVKAITAHHKTIDTLINNAAIQNPVTFLAPGIEIQSITDEITTNFTSVCALTYLLLPTLLTAQKAIILNVNSGLALSPKKTSAVYCGTKGAMNIFSQSLGYQLAETNVAVLQAFLPLVDTSLAGGKGSGEMTAETAASHILRGLRKETTANYIGKAKLLRFLLLTAPFLARVIMKTK